MFTPTSSEWIGILRLTPIILVSILLFSLSEFGLGVAYAKQLHHAPLDESKWDNSKDRRWSTAWFIFYSVFLPFLTICHGSVDTAFYFFAQLNPVRTFTIAILLSVGWVVQITFWCHCDYNPDSKTCYQFYVAENPRSDMIGSLDEVSDGVTATKVGLGMILLSLYIAYLAMAATAVQEMRKSSHVRIEDDEEQSQHDRMENSDQFESLLL